MTNIIFHFLNNHTPLLYLTQSLWRDEVFSVFLAEKKPLEIIRLTAQDFNPPFYYLLLHFWMTIFGQSEISVRTLSFIFHILLVYGGFKFAQKISKSALFHCFIVLLLLFNPMLLYYAFEARMYSLFALLATLSMYHFYKKNWSLYLLFTTLGLYTHSFMIFVLLAQLAYFLSTNSLVVQTVKPLVVALILYSPWLLVIPSQLKKANKFWIYPLDFRTITSSLGNLFLGFEGKPPHLWLFTKILSLIILLFSLKAINFSMKRKRPPSKNAKNPGLLFFIWVFLPLVLILLISFLKPIYVNRYLIFVTVGEVFLIMLGIERIANNIFKKMVIFFFLFFIFYFNFWFTPFHQKKDFRKTLTEINQLLKKDDIVLAISPLNFFETCYYVQDRSRCFLLKSQEVSIPPYVGSVLISEDKTTPTFPSYPKRAFLVNRDTSFEIVYHLH